MSGAYPRQETIPETRPVSSTGIPASSITAKYWLLTAYINNKPNTKFIITTFTRPAFAGRTKNKPNEAARRTAPPIITFIREPILSARKPPIIPPTP